jgi:ribosomal protein L44E
MSVEIQQRWHCNKCDAVTRHDAMANKTRSFQGKTHRPRRFSRVATRRVHNVTKILSFHVEKKAKGILNDIAKSIEFLRD